jgi:hypothetical protein
VTPYQFAENYWYGVSPKPFSSAFPFKQALTSLNRRTLLAYISRPDPYTHVCYARVWWAGQERVLLFCCEKIAGATKAVILHPFS